jgi:ABC-type sugar transport system ATPase subunit
MVTEDRHKEGLFLGKPVSFNVVAANLEKIKTKFGINRRKELSISEEHIRELNIKTPSSSQLVKNLSGGNQQKVVIAKWL